MSGSNNTIVGSGSDSVTLNMAEDQAQGVDAEFTVNVDGRQIGDIQTVTASQSAGQTEGFTFEGNYGTGPHTVTVTFVNNFVNPQQPGDRNVYVDSAAYDGQTISNTTTEINQSPYFPPSSTAGNIYGNDSFVVNDTTPVPAGATSSTTSPAPVSVGSGPDTLVLNVAEDAYLGDAQFTIAVDGQQIGGIQTATAAEKQGQFQEFDVNGNFGPDTHTVSIDFLNDATGPGHNAGITDFDDRNLYVMGMSLDGGPAAADAPYKLESDGTVNFSVTAGSNPPTTAYGSGLFGTDGAVATPENPAIPAGSLTPSSMTFIASATTTGSTGSSPIDPAATTPAATDLTAIAAAPATQDFTIPAATTSSATDTTSTAAGTVAAALSTHTQIQAVLTPSHAG